MFCQMFLTWCRICRCIPTALRGEGVVPPEVTTLYLDTSATPAIYSRPSVVVRSIVSLSLMPTIRRLKPTATREQTPCVGARCTNGSWGVTMLRKTKLNNSVTVSLPGNDHCLASWIQT